MKYREEIMFYINTCSTSIYLKTKANTAGSVWQEVAFGSAINCFLPSKKQHLTAQHVLTGMIILSKSACNSVIFIVKTAKYNILRSTDSRLLPLRNEEFTENSGQFLAYSLHGAE